MQCTADTTQIAQQTQSRPDYIVISGMIFVGIPSWNLTLITLEMYRQEKRLKSERGKVKPPKNSILKHKGKEMSSTVQRLSMDWNNLRRTEFPNYDLKNYIFTPYTFYVKRNLILFHDDIYD